MIENIILSAAYYESFSKFATSLDEENFYTKEEMISIAEDVLDDFNQSVEDSGASKEEIKSLGSDLYAHVIAELSDKNCADINDGDESDVQDLANEIFHSLMKDIGMD